MFKKDLYTEVIRVLNLNSVSVKFKGGYLIALYDGVPYVHEASTLNAYDYVKTQVIPVSEEIAQETPSVNSADRSDYIFQYKIMFKTTREDDVATALDEFRTYFFTNKQVTIDGYTTAIKTSRGDKQGNIMITGGEFYTFYTIKVFATAIKNGYIWKDTDKWEMRVKDTGDYETLKLDLDLFATSGNPIFSNKTGKSKGLVSNTTVAAKLRIFYNGTTIEKQIYSWIMNDVDRDTLFDLKHTFDGELFEYIALISGGARTRTDNATTILEFDWIEADE
jgi:hypothetical protein